MKCSSTNQFRGGRKEFKKHWFTIREGRCYDLITWFPKTLNMFVTNDKFKEGRKEGRIKSRRSSLETLLWSYVDIQKGW